MRQFLFVPFLLAICSIASATPPPEGFVSWDWGEDVLTLHLASIDATFDSSGDPWPEGLQSAAIPGQPDLPVLSLRFLLPGNVDLRSLRLETDGVTFDERSSAEIEPFPEIRPADGMERDTQGRVDPRDPAVYARDAFTPDVHVEIVETGSFRQLPYVSLRYTPYAYNPVRRVLRRVISADVRIRFRTLPAVDTRVPQTFPRVLAGAFPSVFTNAADADRWVDLEDNAGYCIVTTEAVARDCAALETLVNYKTWRGFDVHVVTETDYGSYPGDRAQQIRSWLQDHYLPLRLVYLLLIGDPSPATGDLPMYMTNPRLPDTGTIIYVYDTDAPTDYYYAELTGNWDLDGDGKAGEGISLWNSFPCGEGLPTSYSVRWSGDLVVPVAGFKRFYLISYGRSRLYLDNQEVPLLECPEEGQNRVMARLELEEGFHPIRIEHWQPDGDGYVVVWYDDDDNNWYSSLGVESTRHEVGGEFQPGLWVEYYNEPEFSRLLCESPMTSSVRFVCWEGDLGEGGMEGVPELLVGRIPIYGGDMEALARQIRKMIRYEQQSDYRNEDRSTALLPMKPFDGVTLSYQLGEQIRTQILEPRDFSVTRVYDEPYGIDPPPEHMPCTEANVEEAWRTGRGIVVWQTHGGCMSASGVFWTGQCAALDDRYPSFVYEGSCYNAMPECLGNLASSLLQNGAIGTVGATRVSWYWIGQTDYSACYGSIGCIGYQFADRIARNLPVGQAISEVRSHPSMWDGSTYALANALVFNLYGDPASTLFPESDPHVPPPPQLLLPLDDSACADTAGILDWEDVPGATSYLVQVGDSCGTGTEVQVVTSEAPYADCSHDRTYWWRVRALGNEGMSPFTGCFSFRTSSAPPPTPQTLAPGDTTGCSFPLDCSWLSVPGAIRYDIQVNDACGYGEIISTPDTCMTIETWEHGTPFSWRVRAIGTCERTGPWSVCQTCDSPVPVLIQSFEALPAPGEIALSWEVPRGVQIREFNLYRAAIDGASPSLLNGDPIVGTGPAYRYVDKTIRPRTTYQYNLEGIGANSLPVRLGSLHVESLQVPGGLSFLRTTPSPFTSTSAVEFWVPSAMHVSLVVYDLQGRQVRVLRRGQLSAGRHDAQWTGDDDNGRSAPCGVYFARLSGSDQQAIRRLVFLR